MFRVQIYHGVAVTRVGGRSDSPERPGTQWSGESEFDAANEARGGVVDDGGDGAQNEAVEETTDEPDDYLHSTHPPRPHHASAEHAYEAGDEHHQDAPHEPHDAEDLRE